MADGWALKILSGPSKGKVYPLSLARNDIVLGENVHAEFAYDQGTDAFFIQNITQANGLTLNGQPLQARQALGDGDRIRFGDTEAVLSGPDLIEEPVEKEPGRTPDSRPAGESTIMVEKLSATEEAMEDRALAQGEVSYEREQMVRETREAGSFKVELHETPTNPGMSRNSQVEIRYQASTSGGGFGGFAAAVAKKAVVLAIVGAAGWGVAGYLRTSRSVISANNRLSTAFKAIDRMIPSKQADQASSAPPAAAPTTANPPAGDATADNAVSGAVQETLLQRCKSDVSFCFTTGLAFYNDKNYQAALMFYAKACDGNHGISCVKLAGMYARGDGVAKSDQTAISYYARACQLEIGPACESLGYIYAKGVGVPVSLADATEYNEKACKLGEGEACTEAGLAYKNGIGVSRSPAMAGAFFGKGCALKRADSCDQLEEAGAQ